MEIPREFYWQHMCELTRFISAEVYNGIVFVALVRGQKQVTVQFKLEDFVKTGESMNVCGWLHEIANYPKSIQWGLYAEDWCYISRSSKGHLRFIQRGRHVNLIKEQPWARLIYENEIEFEEYGPLDYRFGRWRGREIDVYKVWMDRDLPLLDQAMKAYRRLQDTNLTYDLLGHLIKPSDESLIGLVTEPMTGRSIELHDAPLVFSALRKLNEIGYILDAPHGGSMLIDSSGGLRITAVHNVVMLPEDPEERQRKIKTREEICRKWVFGEMEKTFGVGPRQRVPEYTRAQIVVPVHVLVPLNDPEKILSLDCSFVGGGRWEKRWIVEKFRDVWSSAHPDHAVEMWKLTRAGGVKRILEDESSEESECETVVPRGRRPSRKLRKKMEAWRSETPLPRLPVAMEDLPLIPTSVVNIQGHERDRSSPLTLVGSRSTSPTVWEIPPEKKRVATTKNAASWILEGDWLKLANTTNIKFII